MKKYNVSYEKNGEVISTAVFEAENIKKARYWAQLHKNRCHEIKGRVKTVITPAV